MNKYDARLRLMKASSDDMVAPSLRCEILSGFPLQSHETNTGMAGKSIGMRLVLTFMNGTTGNDKTVMV